MMTLSFSEKLKFISHVTRHPGDIFNSLVAHFPEENEYRNSFEPGSETGGALLISMIRDAMSLWIDGWLLVARGIFLVLFCKAVPSEDSEYEMIYLEAISPDKVIFIPELKSGFCYSVCNDEWV